MAHAEPVGSVSSTSSSAGTIELNSPIAADGKFWFFPNQGAANVWYQPPPGSGVINGHMGLSFKQFEYWPNLRATLLRNTSGFSVGAAEVGWMNQATLLQWRSAGVPMSTESPSFTQCADGQDLANLDFLGVSPPSPPDFFCSIFAICSPTSGRNDPHGTGWFRTLDNLTYTPEEIVFDERMPNLLPTYDYATITDGSITNWAQRKVMALRDYCTYANTFNSGVDRITGLIHDYVEYAQAMHTHWPNKPPRLSLHWNVHPAWEWGDPAWLDALHARHPDANGFLSAYLAIEGPLHRDTATLGLLVKALCDSGNCPDTVYMDADLTYNSAYSLDVLRRDKAVLKGYNVKFGVDMPDQCTGSDPAGCTVDPTSDGSALVKITRTPDYTPNVLFEESMLNITTFLIQNGIIDADTNLRFETYFRRPSEIGAGVAEYKGHSYSYTLNRVFNEVLIPDQLAK